MPNKIVDTYNHFVGQKGFDYDQISDEVFVAYLIKKGVEIDEAIKYLQSKRPAIHLSTAQFEALSSFKNSLKA